MGSDYDARAWEQIIATLTTLEKDERGLGNHAALVGRARALVAPRRCCARDGRRNPATMPLLRVLRNKAILALGLWGDPAIIGEARRRFAKFEHDPSSLTPDQQETVLTIVGTYADGAMFQRLHKLALAARDVPDVRRRYGALIAVRDPKLAARALQAVMTDPLPPQAQSQKLRLILGAADTNPKLSWAFFKTHEAELTKTFEDSDKAVYLTGAILEVYGNGIPLPAIVSWLRQNFPPSAAPFIKRGVSAAEINLAEKARLAGEVAKLT